jgi:hypothetical protein
MSDLIPTTADVRDAYSSESSDSTYANRMFDAWLARYKAKIVAKTEERIIKLLEHIVEHGTECLMCGNDCSAERLIALIKGEK